MKYIAFCLNTQERLDNYYFNIYLLYQFEKNISDFLSNSNKYYILYAKVNAIDIRINCECNKSLTVFWF